MNFFEKYILKIFLAMSPQIKELLDTFALELYYKALKTESPYDDVGAILLLKILGIDKPKNTEPLIESN